MRRRLLVTTWLVLLALPASARAQGMLTGFVGSTLSAKVGDESHDQQQFTWGFSAGSIGTIGFEVDFGMTNDFVGNTEVVDTRLVTVMGNILFSVPLDKGGPGVRPYATGGIGLIKLNVKDLLEIASVSRSDLGMNVGFGAVVFVSGTFGLRADLRYFRTLTSGDNDAIFDRILGDLSYWRATGGLSLRF